MDCGELRMELYEYLNTCLLCHPKPYYGRYTLVCTLRAWFDRSSVRRYEIQCKRAECEIEAKNR